ncbi:phospholipase A2 inhibitor and Ly6/PLAUR domain-containing protein-like isoform X1 [Rana temporaria]|uniref:phospholipase A2 inhibitor and Ly6/PLAUR domain-containing protein-like isoform X1 n=1 Tax=Rana temporaria TaxID=8407 RepID=UPI001AACF964|nr:phospholipase A2 inhibitor and Ly6/PLAUR domain-containing protein-like isoform X1 [Rana temporaria]
MKTLPSLILVIFISVTTEALICHFCEDLSGPNCKATKSETCPKDVKKCYTNLMMEKFGPLTVYQSTRGCQKGKDLCAGTFSMSSGKTEVHSITKCCEGDHCNTDQLEIVTPKDLKENGVECPACNEKEKQCKSEIYKCTGTQDRCFEFYGGLYNGEGYDDWTFKGCTTKQVCDYLESHDGYEVHYTRKDSKIKCTKK